MRVDRRVRILWLLNHGTAREFELDMMKRLGFEEFFLPKIIPQDPGFRSGSVDYSEDAKLSIPSAELDILNRTEWYGEPSAEAWAVANRYFDIAFFILHNPDTPRYLARNFRGAVIWRVFGLERTTNYLRLLRQSTDNQGEYDLKKLGKRFWFGMAYEHLDRIEEGLLRERAVYLPLGLASEVPRGDWTGDEKKILLVCPDVAINPYYRSIYQAFKGDFDGFPYAIGGAQSVKASDPAVLGFVPKAQHEANMRRYRVMFYHGTEPNHVHYHPFEAVRAGMPLIFMAGGLLDALGGADLPGRCKTIREARRKIRRILNGDRALIDSIRQSQVRLLTAMKPENCVDAWRTGMSRVLRELQRTREIVRPTIRRRPRIAVIHPFFDGRASLRNAKQLALALHLGSRQSGEDAEIVFGHVADSVVLPDAEFVDLPPDMRRRPLQWAEFAPDQAEIAAAYDGRRLSMIERNAHVLPNDGINHFLDCDLWVFASDRLYFPLLPIRPYVMIVRDYAQRYEDVLPADTNLGYLLAARQAERVFVTSEFTFADAVQYAGLPKKKLRRLPVLLPNSPSVLRSQPRDPGAPYFIWTANFAPHRNHARAVDALRRYYEEFDGRLECLITGFGSEPFLGTDNSDLTRLAADWAARPALKRKLRFMGELRDPVYAALLSDAEFYWHASRSGDGSLGVIEAGLHGVPALSADHPALREIDAEFQLGMIWADSNDSIAMARQLKFMERNSAARRLALPAGAKFESHSVERLAPIYWEAVRECL